MRDQKGNLLMSILVGVAIMALMTSISLPYVRKYQNNLQLSGVARNFTSDIRYAQQLTITEQVVYEVTMDTVQNKYNVIKTGAATTTVKSVSFPAGVRFNSVDAALNKQIIFNSFGGVSQSGQIILDNGGDKSAIINIKPSGYVQLAQ